MSFICSQNASLFSILSRRSCARILKETCLPSSVSVSRRKLPNKLIVYARDAVRFDEHEINDLSLDWEGQRFEEVEDLECPWEGAVVYKRSSWGSHLEYCTTLERLGLAKLSSDVSRSRTSSMGLRVTSAVKDYPYGTPVQISVDVTSNKQKLRLDGIVKTVIALNCQRCGEAAAEAVFSNFAVLLSDEVVEESGSLQMGDLFEEGKVGEVEEVDGNEVELDEVLYFPAQEKEIDISKVIRDIVHVEMTMNALCDPNCRGLCTSCGTNLNRAFCKCRPNNVKANQNSPFRGLRQIQF